MNAFLPFVLGLGLGLAIWWLWHQRFRQRLRQILSLFPPHIDESSSLSLVSRLRRALKLTMAEYAELGEQVERLQQILAAAPFGYLQVDGADQLNWCNAYSRELLKIDRWQPDQTRLLLELVRSYELDQLVAATRATGQPQAESWVYQATEWQAQPLGEAISVPYAIAIQAHSLPLAAGAVGIFLANQQPLVNLRQSRDHAFTDLAHELRTPLTAIQLVAEALQPRLVPPERDWMTQMLAEVERLMALVQGYLTVSELHAEPLAALEREALQLDELIRDAWQRLTPLAQPKRLKLDYAGNSPCQLQGDRRRLEQVLLNILDNAIKHSPADSTIQVCVTCLPKPERESPAQIAIDTIDAGSGFAIDDFERVFERLYRSDRSRQRDPGLPATERSQRGSGLGLAIAREIVRAHGGTISARNHPETGGAWLQIRLPCFY